MQFVGESVKYLSHTGNWDEVTSSSINQMWSRLASFHIILLHKTFMCLADSSHCRRSFFLHLAVVYTYISNISYGLQSLVGWTRGTFSVLTAHRRLCFLKSMKFNFSLNWNWGKSITTIRIHLYCLNFHLSDWRSFWTLILELFTEIILAKLNSSK